MSVNIPNTKFVISNRLYEQYCGFFDNMELKANSFAPDPDVIIKDVLPNLEDNIIFLMWVDETGFETDLNSESRAMVREILKKCLDITD